MDVREKLVELLKEIVAIQECGFGDPRPTYETVASYLISHGVTVQEWISVDERIPQILTRSRNMAVSVDQKNMMIWNGTSFDCYKPTLKNEMEAKEE